MAEPDGMAEEEFALRNIGAVPDLFGNQAGLPSNRLHRLREMLGDVRPSRGELVVRALAGQERPGASNACSVIRTSVGVFTVSVALIPMPGGAARRFHLQGRINDFDGAQDPRIVRRAEPEPDERERVETDHQGRRTGRLIRRPVLDRDKPLTRRRGIAVIGLRDPDVIPVDTVQLREFGPLHVQPSLDAGVPGVGGLPQILGGDRVRRRVGEIGGDEERRDLCRNRERRVSRLFLPSVLRTDRTVAREKDGRPAHHRPQRVPSRRVDDAFARRKIDQQNRERRFIHLHAVPVRACRRATCSATSGHPAPASPAGTAARA